MITIDDISFNLTKEQIERESYLSRAIPKLLGHLNILIDKQKANYTVKIIEGTIRHGQPIKITVWVCEIKDRAKFYNLDEGQNMVHRKYVSVDWFIPIEHLIDIREF